MNFLICILIFIFNRSSSLADGIKEIRENEVLILKKKGGVKDVKKNMDVLGELVDDFSLEMDAISNIKA